MAERWRPGRLSSVSGAFALVLFALLAIAVQSRALADFDREVMLGLQGPDVWWLITWATFTGVVASGPVSIACFVLASYLLSREGSERWWVPLAALALVTAVELLLKSALDQRGEDLYQFVRRTFYPFVTVEMAGTFPSGHTARAALLLVFLWRWLPRGRWGDGASVLGLAALSVAIGFSRIYVGDHWPSDVLGGLLLGGGVGLLATPLLATFPLRTDASGPEGERIVPASRSRWAAPGSTKRRGQ